ncbi:MAG TPA: aldo/keto reductase [Rhizomicrobium sp.]|nr:aldo/keto reductase [Rhizomicrobium sp.]
MATFVMRSGARLDFSALGFGSATFGNLGRVFSEDECDATMTRAWESGARYFDTAPLYGLGLSEQRVGRALRQRPRDQFVLSTKVGRVLVPGAPNGGIYVGTPQVRYVYDYSRDGVMRSFEDSLRRLGLDRVDILFVHDVDAPAHGGREGSNARIRELMETGGWRALDDLRRSGVVSAIGLGVNEWQPCARMLELADPDLFLLAGRYTLLEQEPVETLFPQCAKAGVRIVIGGPYNSGVLAGKATYDYAKTPPDVVARVAKLEAFCTANGVELRAAALQFVAAHPLVVSVIPGAASPQEIDGNVALMRAVIPPALWRDLKADGLLHPDAPIPLSRET